MIDIKTIRPGFDVGPMALRTSELGNGCGAFTTRPIEDGEVVFALPLSAIITTVSAVSDPSVGEALELVLQEDGERASLAGFLARERLSDLRKGASLSRFSAYSAILPTRGSAAEADDDHMLWWSAVEVALLRRCCAAHWVGYTTS